MKSTEQLKIIEKAIEACKDANAAKGNGYDSKEYTAASINRAVALDEIMKAFGLESLQQAMDVVTACDRFAKKQVRKAEREFCNQ